MTAAPGTLIAPNRTTGTTAITTARKGIEMHAELITTHPPQRSESTTRFRADARSLQDRIALRIGLALISWTRRHDARRGTDAERLQRRRDNLAAIDHRERDAQRRALMLRPPL